MTMKLFLIIIFFSTLNTALFYLAQKWGFIDRLKQTKIRILYLLFSCEFCVFFWLAMIELASLFFAKCPFGWFGVLMVIPFSLCASVFSCFFLRSNR